MTSITKEQRLDEINKIKAKYKNLGHELKSKLELYNNTYGEAIDIDRDEFFECFATPLFGDTPEDFKKFQSYFVNNN